jgi:para-nitrobenzyl esterase
MREKENRATPFQPVIDGKDLPEAPMAAIGKGSASNITLMSGNSRDELKSMSAMNPALANIDEAGVIDRLSKMLPPDMVPGLVRAYRESRQQEGTELTPADILGSINTDLMFRIPTIRLVEAQHDNGARAYNYLFAYKSPAMGGALGAMHGLDNPFLFGSLDAQFTGNTPDCESLALKMQDSCIAFVRTGDPSCESAGKWPVYAENRATMVFDINTRVENAYFEEERRAWDGFDVTSAAPI